MGITSIVRSVQEISTKYRTILATLDPAYFMVRPSADAWSLSEIYHHVFDSSILSLEAIESLAGGVNDGGDATLVGKAILFTGAFPPGLKFKAPARLLARLQAIEYAKTEELIRNFDVKFEAVSVQAGQLAPELRRQHPRLGFFNAEQWLRFTEIHLKHHLKQAERTLASVSTKERL
ncbi:MAG: DinB family protein [Moraxellaceae bacterium]|nr:MAG: DinB family protein [Moraxellaceae bacterium]